MADGRAGYAELGARVELSGDAVRERLKRLIADDVIQVIGSVSPTTVGLDSFALVGITVPGRPGTAAGPRRVGAWHSGEYSVEGAAAVAAAGGFLAVHLLALHQVLGVVPVEEHLDVADRAAGGPGAGEPGLAEVLTGVGPVRRGGDVPPLDRLRIRRNARPRKLGRAFRMNGYTSAVRARRGVRAASARSHG
ncbi:Lrp/AsnC family transcriptional regulator [Streptomyces sp. ME02-8801-2C]|uniref:Lrp/AsnC family transcriptional regulator n=1 Tax=Streptomyces sp. ME02-8801-2C TaxID=3028680 RepID=UPI0039F704E6